MAALNHGGRGGSPGADGPRSWKERWHRFVFDDQSEKDRFGVFDPFLRMMYAFAVALGAGLAVVSIVEGADAASRGGAAAVAGAIGLLALVGGGLVYKAIWRTPSEREILLQMAREEDEARSVRARMDTGAGGTKKEQ